MYVVVGECAKPKQKNQENEANQNNNIANNSVNHSGDSSGQSPLNTQGSSQSANQDKRLQWLFLSLWLLTSLGWFVHLIYLKKK